MGQDPQTQALLAALMQMQQQQGAGVPHMSPISLPSGVMSQATPPASMGTAMGQINPLNIISALKRFRGSGNPASAEALGGSAPSVLTGGPTSFGMDWAGPDILGAAGAADMAGAAGAAGAVDAGIGGLMDAIASMAPEAAMLVA
jgi:hypothetical protein